MHLTTLELIYLCELVHVSGSVLHRFSWVAHDLLRLWTECHVRTLIGVFGLVLVKTLRFLCDALDHLEVGLSRITTLIFGVRSLYLIFVPILQFLCGVLDRLEVVVKSSNVIMFQ